MSGVLYVRDVDDEILDALKAAARQDGVSLSTYVARELGRMVAQRRNAVTIDRARQYASTEVTSEDIVEAVRLGRADREPPS